MRERDLPDTAIVIHLPIEHQPEGTVPEAFGLSREEGGPVDGVLAEMNAYLDRLGMSIPWSATAKTGRPPEVRFGCLRPGSFVCDASDPVWGGGGRLGHWLSVLGPSDRWVSWLGGLLEESEATHALVIALEISEYWPGTGEAHGERAVDLGSGHVVNLPWHTCSERPVSVRQLTGALVGSDGRALTVGAEGLLAKANTLLDSALGFQALLTEEDVEQLRTQRREDLDGKPLVWEIALGTLVSNLLAPPHE